MGYKLIQIKNLENTLKINISDHNFPFIILFIFISVYKRYYENKQYNIYFEMFLICSKAFSGTSHLPNVKKLSL